MSLRLMSTWDSFSDTLPSCPSWSSSTSSTSTSSSPDYSLPSPLAACENSISKTRGRQHSNEMCEDADADADVDNEEESTMKFSAWRGEDFAQPITLKSQSQQLRPLKVEDAPPLPIHLSNYSSSCSSSSSPVSPKLEELLSPPTSSSSDASPSNISPSSSSSSCSSRRRRRGSTSTARLESHRKYDTKRRRTFRSLFEQLRGILKSADSTATHAKCVLQSSLEANELEMRMAALEKNIEDLSTRELMLRASKMIRQLTEAKQKLERQLEGENDGNGEENDSEIQDSKDKTAEAMENTESLVPIKKRRKLCSSSSSAADDASLDSLNTLIHTISVLNQYYSEEMKSVAREQQCLPQSITDISLYFPGLSVSGADGRMALLPDLVGDEYCSIRSWVTLCNSRGIDLLSCIREPLIYQIHALCFVLSNKFAYKSHQILEAPQKSARKANALLGANTIFQSLYQSIQTQQQHSAATSASSWFTAEVSEDELQQHPLGGYALPRASAQALLEVLSYLASLGEAECQRQITQLLPIAFATFPTLFSTVSLPFLGMTTREVPKPQKVKRLHPLLDPSYDLVSEFYKLYTGEKPMITVVRPIPSPNARILYAERDIILVRHSSGLPLAHLTCNIRLRFGEEY